MAATFNVLGWSSSPTGTTLGRYDQEDMPAGSVYEKTWELTWSNSADLYAFVPYSSGKWNVSGDGTVEASSGDDWDTAIVKVTGCDTYSSILAATEEKGEAPDASVVAIDYRGNRITYEEQYEVYRDKKKTAQGAILSGSDISELIPDAGEEPIIIYVRGKRQENGDTWVVQTKWQEVKILPRADYTSVDEVLQKIPDDLDIYTTETVKILNDAVSRIDRGKNSSEQELVEEMAKDVQKALDGLKYRLTEVKAKEASCTEDGNIRYWMSAADGKYFLDAEGEQEITKEETVRKATGHLHTEVRNAKKATYTSKGYTGDTYCKDCGKKIKNGKSIAMLAFTKEKINSCSNLLNTGVKLTVNTGSLKVTWGKVSEASGYDIFAAKCGKNLKLVKTVKGTNKLSTNLTKVNGSRISKNAGYKVRIRAYRIIDGKKRYIANSLTLHAVGKSNSQYTNPSKLKASKNAYTLKKGKTGKLNVKITKQNSRKKFLSTAHAARLRYWSTNTKVASVSSGGKIKGVGKGSCYIYIVGQNGAKTRVKITVK